MSEKKIGNVFHYAGQDKPGAVRLMKLIDEKYIKSFPVLTVQRVVCKIKAEINKYETNDIKYVHPNELKHKIFKIDDVVFMVANIGKWRRGSAYVVVQISEKNDGAARVSIYTTNTIFHSAQCFGTTPSKIESQELLDEYVNLKNIDTLMKDLALLKNEHSTKKTVGALIASLQY